MGGKLTKAQRKVVQYIADNPGKLYSSRRDIPTNVGRWDVLWRAVSAGFVDPPRVTATHTWEVTPAGREALPQGGGEAK